MILGLALTMAGCGVSRKRAIAPVPGCSAAQVYIGPGCYAQRFADRLEVRCTNKTVTYSCKG
jgi:hypothetical protein